MDSEGSVESLNWFIEGEGGEEDMDLGLISVNGNSNFMNGNGAPSSAKKRSKSGRSKTTRIQGSESPTFSEDNSSGLRHRSKKSAVAREHKTGVKTEKSSSSNNSHSSSADAALLLENNNTFFDTMKTSQSRLSRSLSNNRGNSGGAALSQKSLQQLGADQSSTLNASSGDESCSGRSEAAMVAEQKFKDKNREHARNTRSRKKLYIETLKQAFAELSAERKQIEKKKLDAAAQLEQRSVARKQALRTMFFYRATGELSREKWEAILEPEFKLLLPVTPYRSFPPEEVINGQRHVDGIDAMIRDIASLRVMVQSIGSHQREDTEVRVRYYSGLDDTVMSGDSFMCRWILRTENAVECGACHECFKQGMVHAKFSPNHKLIRLELSYDVMCFMQQLRRASGKRYFEVVPNTVASAVEDCDDPNDDSARIITLASPPYTIVKVSRAWCELTGFSAAEAIGRTNKILQGNETEHYKLKELMHCIRGRLPAYTVLTNYTKNKERFINFLRICPLYTEGAVSHFIGLVERVPGNEGVTWLGKDDLSINDAISATDSNMAIGYPPSPLSSLSSSSSNASSTRLRRKESSPFIAVPYMITTSQATAQHNKAGGGGLILVKPGRKPDDFSSSTDQSSRCNSISATNTSSLENLSGGSDDPTRTSDSARLPSLSGNTDRSNESEVAAAEAENKNKNNRSIDVVNENGESILQQFKGSVASSGQPQA